MRPPALALLAVLFAVTPVAADGLVVEPGLVAPGRSIVVSWRLPDGFEESELLIQVEGGPRVRLTDESREAHPSFVVRIPALAGRARFLVRAGRLEPDGRHREHTVATSEPFTLGPTVAPGPLPFRALASRPASGEAMEWWSEAGGPAVEGPATGLGRRQDEWSPDVGEAAAALPAPRPDALRSRDASEGAALDAREPESAPEAGFRHRAFAGAPVPLRN